jgi:hypothetical protein
VTAHVESSPGYFENEGNTGTSAGRSTLTGTPPLGAFTERSKPRHEVPIGATTHSSHHVDARAARPRDAGVESHSFGAIGHRSVRPGKLYMRGPRALRRGRPMTTRHVF